MEPVEFPIPALTIESFQFRVSSDDAHERFVLRITPAMPVGATGQSVPATQNHIDTAMTPDTLEGMVAAFAQVLTPEQRGRWRAILSDVQLPDKPAIVLPGGSNGRGPA